jgi:hypothetical protein
MRRIKIFGRALSGVEAAAAVDFAAEAGFTAAEIEVTASVGEPLADCDDEIVLVVMTPATCADVSLEEELAKTPNGGRRAICVWPTQGDIPDEHPSAAKKYAYSIIPWDAEKLRAVAADDDVFCFETPAGEPLPTVETERNLCVVEVKPEIEEKAKPT